MVNKINNFIASERAHWERLEGGGRGMPLLKFGKPSKPENVYRTVLPKTLPVVVKLWQTNPLVGWQASRFLDFDRKGKYY